jgi:hypothetical protein
VFEHQQPILRQDLQREAQFQIEEHSLQEGVRSYGAVPLIVRGLSLGVIVVVSLEKNSYPEREVALMREVSAPVGLADQTLLPFCSRHFRTRLICPRCIASGGGQMTATKHNYSCRVGEGKAAEEKKASGWVTK